MKPLIVLCCKTIPQLASASKKAKILDSALYKIQTSVCRFESKYCMFEFAFMPIALTCVKSKEDFDVYFTPKLVAKFIETFFLRKGGQDGLWRTI